MVYSSCQGSSAISLSLTFCTFYLGQPGGHLLGKSCALSFPLLLSLVYAVLIAYVPFLYLGQDMEFDCIGSC